MTTTYIAHTDTAEGKYTIQFETGNYEYFEQVEKACRKVIGLRDKAVDKERCAQMRTVGHL